MLLCVRYTVAAQDLVVHARGVLNSNGWRTPAGALGSGDDISVFVIPLKQMAAAPSGGWGPGALPPEPLDGRRSPGAASTGSSRSRGAPHEPEEASSGRRSPGAKSTGSRRSATSERANSAVTGRKSPGGRSSTSRKSNASDRGASDRVAAETVDAVLASALAAAVLPEEQCDELEREESTTERSEADSPDPAPDTANAQTDAAAEAH